MITRSPGTATTCALFELYAAKSTRRFPCVQQGVLGPSARAFPLLTVPVTIRSAARGAAFLFCWLFALNGTLYLSRTSPSGHMRKFFGSQRYEKSGNGLIISLRFTPTRRANTIHCKKWTPCLRLLTPLGGYCRHGRCRRSLMISTWLPAGLLGRPPIRRALFIFISRSRDFFPCAFRARVHGADSKFFQAHAFMISGWYKEQVPTVDPQPP